MELVGVMYPNMAKSTYRNYFMECLLSGMDFPNVHRIEAYPATDYENKVTLCDAAIADGFPFFELLKTSWMSKIDTACQWTWCAGLRAMKNMLNPGECMLYMLDDHFINRNFYAFHTLVKPLEDLQILQMFQWDPCVEGDHGFDNPERFPASNFAICEAQPEVYHGFNLAGDAPMIFSKDGASRALDWIAEFPYEYLETHVLRRSQMVLPGCYSLVNRFHWIGFIESRIVGSYREDFKPDNLQNME